MDNDQYEVEHFGFTVKQLTLERRYVITKFLDNALHGIIKKLSKNEETFNFLSEAKSKIINNVWVSIEHRVQDIENLDKATFSIPKQVLLAIDDELNSFTKEDEDAMDDTLDKLKQKYLQNTMFLTSLKMENSQYESVNLLTNEEVKVQEQVQEAYRSFDIKKVAKLVQQVTSLQ